MQYTPQQKRWSGWPVITLTRPKKSSKFFSVPFAKHLKIQKLNRTAWECVRAYSMTPVKFPQRDAKMILDSWQYLTLFSHPLTSFSAKNWHRHFSVHSNWQPVKLFCVHFREKEPLLNYHHTNWIPVWEMYGDTTLRQNENEIVLSSQVDYPFRNVGKRAGLVNTVPYGSPVKRYQSYLKAKILLIASYVLLFKMSKKPKRMSGNVIGMPGFSILWFFWFTDSQW